MTSGVGSMMAMMEDLFIVRALSKERLGVYVGPVTRGTSDDGLSRTYV